MPDLRYYLLIVAASWLPFGAAGQNANADKPSPAASAESVSRTVEDGGTGPYQALMTSDASLPTYTVFRPKDLGALGDKLKLPIVVWGNGACANSPWEHVNFLSEVASHGFLVVAIGPMPAEGQRGGPGGPTKSPLLVNAIDWALAQNRDTASRYYQKLDTNKIAVAGMSCGGLQALEVAPDSRIVTTMIFNSGILPDPGTGRAGMPKLPKEHLAKLRTPTLYVLGGEKDIAYKNGMDDVRRIKPRAYLCSEPGRRTRRHIPQAARRRIRQRGHRMAAMAATIRSGSRSYVPQQSLRTVEGGGLESGEEKHSLRKPLATQNP